MKDAVVVVTGAGRGIGRAIALAFARRGARLAVASRTARDLDLLAARIAEAGPPALAVPMDVRDEAAVAAFAARVARERGGADVVVNNAGIYRTGDVASMSTADWRETIDTNLTGAFLVTRAFLPLLAKSRKGHLFVVGSIASRRVFAGSAAYCASKFGLLGLTETLREELRGAGVRVTAVLPGATDTSAWDGKGRDAERGRMLRAEDVAEAVAAAYATPAGCSIDELTITPASGPL